MQSKSSRAAGFIARVKIDGPSSPSYYADEQWSERDKGSTMPSSQKVPYQQFEVSARPTWWLRRWTRFPLYFQATQPRFDLIVKRVSASPIESKQLRFYMDFVDKSQREWSVDVSTLRNGQTFTYTTENNLLSPTGDTRICLDRGAGEFNTLYAFVVSSETTLAFLILNLVLGGLIALLLRL